MTKDHGTPGDRVISPDAATSTKLARCELGAQLLFDRLLVTSDDQGRQCGEASVVRGACFPRFPKATTALVKRWLAQMHAQDLVKLYDTDDGPVVQITQWWRYQAGMRRAYPSRWRAPEGWHDRIYGMRRDPRPGVSFDDETTRSGGKMAGTFAADSPPGAGAMTATGGQSAPKSAPLPLPLPMPIPSNSLHRDDSGVCAPARASSPGARATRAPAASSTVERPMDEASRCSCGAPLGGVRFDADAERCPRHGTPIRGLTSRRCMADDSHDRVRDPEPRSQPCMRCVRDDIISTAAPRAAEAS